ncbi:hypothetical protein FHS31_000418 [Sphingomonas vulcanisoli]|uniref:DUF883 family protein n=1 Tax=Sphingomonas vulcanisoli TaxID=1658060 RepID=A0ABX0TTA3_9SPHN|nr:hypothetical protein [Sphingomonas vulcanisoli]NIJ06836.1 hypothetical protein [Sphingomonas vulcanisoli]
MSKAANDIEPNQSLVTQKVVSAYETARDKASAATQGAIEGIGGNPLIALLSGLALGAAAGALLPRGDREKALLAPLGTRIGDAAAAAIEAGREAGVQALDEQGLSIEGLREQAAKLFGALTEVAGTAAAEGLAAAKTKVQS